MLSLAVAALVWVGVHVGIAGSPIRRAIVSRIGEGGFRAAFSVVSFLAIGWLIAAWRLAPAIPLWAAGSRLVVTADILMAFACVFFVGAITTRNPGAIGAENAPPMRPHGMLRITRHPGLWSFALWAAAHTLTNGDAASLLFFGAFFTTALAGMPSIDRKVARRNPAAWAAIAPPATSILPGAALVRNPPAHLASEIGWLAPFGGVALFVMLVLLHPFVFGVPALPPG